MISKAQIKLKSAFFLTFLYKKTTSQRISYLKNHGLKL